MKKQKIPLRVRVCLALLGMVLLMAGLWGGSYLVHVLPPWLELAAVITGALSCLGGVFLVMASVAPEDVL